MSDMTCLKLLDHCGIAYYDPVFVKAARKEQFWQMTGRIMQLNNPSGDAAPYEIEAIKVAFHHLPMDARQAMLFQQRSYLINSVAKGLKKSGEIDHADLQRGENPLPLSFVDNMFYILGTPRRGKRDQTHSYKNASVNEVFQGHERIYLPLAQFDVAQEDGGSDEIIALSRHPYDIMRMSTHRSWKSCMKMPDGLSHDFIAKDIVYGTIAAYVFALGEPEDANTDWNLANPSSRGLLKPSHSADSGTIIYQRDKIFGAYNEPFKNALDRISREWFSREGRVGEKYDTPKGLYSESITDELVFSERHQASYPVRSASPTKDFANNMFVNSPKLGKGQSPAQGI